MAAIYMGLSGKILNLPQEIHYFIFLHLALSQFFLVLFLSAFAELLKATVSFVISVRLSVLIEQLSFHCTYFYI